MKKVIRKVLLSFIMLLLLTNTIDTQAAEVETIKLSEQFPDAGMQWAVKQVMEVSSVDAEIPIEDFKKVTTFSYYATDVKIISLEGISIFSNLTSLTLIKNDLTEIHPEIGDLANLENLYIETSETKKLPETIGNLSKLSSLFLHNNKLTSLPEAIGNLSNLKSLTLSYIPITSLPETIGNLKKLEKISLNRNKLTSLPKSIGGLEKLDSFGAHFNQITDLPEEIGDLPNLTVLSVMGNKLTSLPDSIGKLTKMERLNVSANQITAIPQSLYSLLNLKRVDFAFNSLSDITIEELKSIPSPFLDYREQRYALEKKGALGYPYPMKMSTLMKSFHTGGFLGNMDVELYQYTNEVDQFGNKKMNQIAKLNSDVVDFEKGTMIVPQENFTAAGHYALLISTPTYLNCYLYNFEMETIDVTFSGLPEKVEVGDTFTLVPSIDDQQGSAGWEWDSEAFDATFNSPATFVAKKAGLTDITYKTVDGYTITTEIDVIEKPYELRFDSNGGIGEMNAITYLYNEEKTLAKNTFTRHDYIFEGWALSKEDADKKIVSILDEANYKLEIRETITLHAVWSAIEIQLSTLPESIFVGNEFTITTNVKGTWSYAATMLEIVETNEKSTTFHALKDGDAILTFYAENGEEIQADVHIEKVVEVPEPEKPKQPSISGGEANTTNITTKSNVPATGDVQNVVHLLGILIFSLFVIPMELRKLTRKN